MTAPSRPGRRPGIRTVLPPALAAAVPAIAVVGGTAATIVPPDARMLFASGGGTLAVLLGAAVAVAAHHRITARLLHGRLDAVSSDLGRLLQDKAGMQAEFGQELERRADEAALERRRLADDLEGVRGDNARLAERARRAETERATAISATANAAARLQALANGILADLRSMEDKHSDEEVLADLLHLDHRTAQAGRVADSVAVLSGARSGRRWARPIPMESILRGAMGRIGGYQRVRVHSASETAVVGHAAEGVMHVLAELLDNATNFSPPTSEVHVYVEEVPAGALVSVEDSGLVMGDVQLRRAERAVSGDITGLGGLTGTRLGLAVVGRLSRKHGLKVSFRPSARGGTGVLVLLPQDILTAPDEPLPALPAAVPGASHGIAGTTAADPDDTPVHTTASAGFPERPALPEGTPSAADGPEERTGETGSLPRRSRGRTLAAAERSRARSAPTAEQSAPSTDIPTQAARFTSFRQAVRGGSTDSRTAGGPRPAPAEAHTEARPGPLPGTRPAPGSDAPSA
ncbi:ATP-binding protein [Streptomyces sp. NPDC093094]|uniref:ATP-binding protein n=1 Tax=Streptomyces sp. NPDC093094 TaxID=3366026 RepID=UPI0038031B3B